jgi:hypothetical protein
MMNNHNERMKQIDRDIFNCKKDMYHKSFEISKLRIHVGKYQTLLRKNGIQETEVEFEFVLLKHFKFQ